MATNYIQDGDVLTLTAPYQRNSGLGALVGSIFGVSLGTVASGATGEFAVEGVFSLAKTSAQAWSVGDRIYWDDTNKRCDTDPTVGPLIGCATAAAANPSSTGYVRLNEGVPGLDEAKQGAQVADVTTAAATDLATSEALANQLKTTVNAILAQLRATGIIKT